MRDEPCSRSRSLISCLEFKQYSPQNDIALPFSSREKRVGTLKVDNENPISGISLEGASQLDTDGVLWIGKILSPLFSISCTRYKSVQDLHIA